MLVFDLESVGSPIALPEGAIDPSAFGARYISLRNVNRFLEQVEELDPGLIVWPGGTVAETRTDRYGFEYDGLYEPSTGKPGLYEMMEIAVAENTGLSLIVPTARYADDPDALTADLNGFLGELLAGDFGPLPNELILEIGNEYYAHFDGPSAASDYAELAEAAVTEIALALADPTINQIGADIEIAVQSGRTLEDDTLIRDGLSDFAQSNVDMIVQHRFALQPEGIDARAELAGDILGTWTAEAAGLGADAPELFVSAWNVASYTRKEALDDYVAETGVDPATIDLDGRSDAAFETFWQDELGRFAYGPEHSAFVLEAFTSYVEEGAASAAIFGTDSIHPGRLSLRDVDGDNRVFAGGEMYEMLRESVVGMSPIGPSAPYDQDAPATVYGFEDDDKLIAFVAAGDTPPGDILIPLDGIKGDFIGVWADSLRAEINPNWRADFGIPDTPGVDETPEAWTYADGIRSAAETHLGDDVLTVALDAPHEIVRIAFAKTAEGAAEIETWSDGDGQNLEAQAILEDLPVVPEPPIVEDDNQEDGEGDGLGDDGGGGGSALAAFGLLPLLLLGF
ncbi:MAG: hypothetical protein AAGK37_00120 [Pseudomonadota bacterium]